MRATSHRLSIAVALALLFAAAVATFRISIGPLHATASTNDPAVDPRLKKAYRFTQDGWTYVHLEGAPSEIGFQHGYLLAPEIEDAFYAVQVEDTFSVKFESEEMEGIAMMTLGQFAAEVTAKAARQSTW